MFLLYFLWLDLMVFSILGLNWGQNEMSNLTITKDAVKDQKFDKPVLRQCLFLSLNVNNSCSSLELTFLESGNQQLSIFIVNKWITRIVFIFKLFYYTVFNFDRSKWPASQTFDRSKPQLDRTLSVDWPLFSALLNVFFWIIISRFIISLFSKSQWWRFWGKERL